MQSACAVLYSSVHWSLYHIFFFSHFLIIGTIFEKKETLLHTKCVFWFSLQSVAETFLMIGRIKLDMTINVQGEA